MTLQIRVATRRDLDSIVTVFLACWHNSYRSLLPAATITAMTEVRARELWAARFVNDGRTEGESADQRYRESAGSVATDDNPNPVVVLVAARGSDVLGVTRYSRNDRSPRTGFVHSLYVSPRAQGTGAGSALLRRAEADMGVWGFTSAVLWVFAANDPALGFYRHHGWMPDGTSRSQLEFGVPELRLQKVLSHHDQDAP
ncbi:MAG: hypothetical protein B5766_02785 [Candidatus Lumbricidophila eiseniae]|uniref:N-acetyltransferase domain-containing protein n=1 Tax=Candidatus Lumbricidiphila eiseniae TaxID=1969409 RepID=A0A2A6FTU9_9MICO|nr:MAG: hypothetical protein B5766_02785 [Candidatus Lumbricidophila eiseniae]